VHLISPPLSDGIVSRFAVSCIFAPTCIVVRCTFPQFFLHVKVVLLVLAICILQSRRQLVPWWLSYHASKLVQVSCYDVRAGRVAERGEFPTLTVRWHRQQNNTAMLKTLP
jgi:hypothetical protein